MYLEDFISFNNSLKRESKWIIALLMLNLRILKLTIDQGISLGNNTTLSDNKSK